MNQFVDSSKFRSYPQMQDAPPVKTYATFKTMKSFSTAESDVSMQVASDIVLSSII